MRKFSLVLTAVFSLMALVAVAQPGGNDVPPNGQPGKCYAKCLIPDQYETVTEQIETKGASSRLEVVPATFETVTEQIVVKPESKRVITIPAEYTTVTEQVMVKPESKRLVTIPATYETTTERIEVKPASRRLVAMPTEYETVTEQVMVKAESKRIITIPATYETVTEQVMVRGEQRRIVAVGADGNVLGTSDGMAGAGAGMVDGKGKKVAASGAMVKAGTTFNTQEFETTNEQMMVKSESKRMIAIPATYETVTERMEVKPASKRMIAVPAVYETVTEQYEMQPASTRVEVMEPKYESVTERIEVSPSTTKWVKRAADRNCLSADPNDCLVWCLVEVPAEYKTVTRRVNKGCDGSGVANSGCTKTVQIPAKMGTRTKQILKAGATVREEEIPAEYTTVTKQVIKTPASVREEVIPAEYKTVARRVAKGGFTTREEVIPAEYTTVTKQIVKTPATTREEVIPAEYKTVSKQVAKICSGVLQADGCTVVGNNGTTLGMYGKCADKTKLTGDAKSYISPCYREEVIPAEYSTVAKQVVKTPATTREEVIPAEYKTITKRVVKTPATTREEPIAAEYKTVSKQVMKSAATTREIAIPAEYTTVSKRKLVKQGGFTEWREVLCASKVTSYTIRQIQAALRSRGYEPGPEDNILGVRTKAALTKFQKDKGLPVGSLDLETLKALGVNY